MKHVYLLWAICTRWCTITHGTLCLVSSSIHFTTIIHCSISLYKILSLNIQLIYLFPVPWKKGKHLEKYTLSTSWQQKTTWGKSENTLNCVMVQSCKLWLLILHTTKPWDCLDWPPSYSKNISFRTSECCYAYNHLLHLTTTLQRAI